MKTRLDNSDDAMNIWPLFSDIALMVILILCLIVLLQFVLGHDVFKMEEIAKRKTEVWQRIQQEFPYETSEHSNEETQITHDPSSPQMLTIQFSNSILFPQGGADPQEISKDGIRILKKMAELIISFDGYFREIKVQGHTDNIPYKNSDKYNNWDLSSDRATAVVKTIIEGIPENKRDEYQTLMVAAGYSMYRHRVPNLFDKNGNPKGNESNRRIDIEFEFAYTKDEE